MPDSSAPPPDGTPEDGGECREEMPSEHLETELGALEAMLRPEDDEAEAGDGDADDSSPEHDEDS